MSRNDDCVPNTVAQNRIRECKLLTPEAAHTGSEYYGISGGSGDGWWMVDGEGGTGGWAGGYARTRPLWDKHLLLDTRAVCVCRRYGVR